MLAQQAPPAARPKTEHTIDNMFSISVFYWRPDQGQPGFFAGKQITTTVSHRLDLGHASRGNGAVITFPTKGFNRLELGYWETRGSGSTRATEPLSLFAANLRTGALIASKFQIRDFRLSWNYLTYPVPAFDAKLRIKTFWEVQSIRMKPDVSFPESSDPTAKVGDTQTITWPGVGIGMEFVPSKRVRMEARISGMALPGKSRYADAEINLVGNLGHLEIFGGGKGFHVRTSPKSEIYQQATIWGPIGGIRWVFR